MTLAYKLGAIKVIVNLLSHRAFIAPIADRVCDPLVDGGLIPACAVDADLHLVGKSAFLDLAVERGAAKARPVEDGLNSYNTISAGCHG